MVGTGSFYVERAAGGKIALRFTHPGLLENAIPRWQKNRVWPLDSRHRVCINTIVQISFVLSMQIHLSTSDGVPIYLQIVNQVKYLVASGKLQAGEELPPIRTLAERLLINPNTVARAYRELELAGVVTKRRTAGTYVSAAGSPLARRERLKILADRVDALLAEARQMNVDTETLVDLVRQRDEALDATTRSPVTRKER